MGRREGSEGKDQGNSRLRAAGGGKMDDGVKYDGSKQNGKQGGWLDRKEWSL